jgi:hypothetical protein
MRETRYLPIVAILLLAAFLRAWISDFTLILSDYDAFYHARIAEFIYTNHKIPCFDTKELGGIPHYYPPLYHLMIAAAKYVLPEPNFITIGSLLTVFFGTLSVFFVYLIGRRMGEGIGLLSALIYTITPMMVLRSGLWARPTGISMLFAIAMVYLFLNIKEKRDNYAKLAAVASAAYMLAHSSIFFVLALILATSILARNKSATEAFFTAALVSLFVGGAYYYRALPHFNFSISGKGEYMPLVAPLKELYPLGVLEAAFVALLFLGLFNLAFFPLVYHGVYGTLKQEKELGILTLISLLLIFFKANMFMLLNFTVCIAIAVSIFRVSGRFGNPAAGLLLLAVLGMDAALLQNTHGEKKAVNADIIEEILSGAPLTSENLVLPSDPNVGHAIPYYSPASTFISDLTDTKQYDKNREVFNKLKDENTSPDEAMALLIENNIDHLIITGDPFPFMKGSNKKLILIRETEKNGVKAKLYRLKE